jgi:hypothetical protein
MITNLIGREHLEDSGTDGRMLKWILNRMRAHGLNFIWFILVSCKNSHEPSAITLSQTVSITCTQSNIQRCKAALFYMDLVAVINSQ